YRRVWAAFSVILLGWPFTGMRVITAGVFPFRFTTSISRSRRLETYAHVVLMLCAGSGVGCAIATQNGYSPPGMPGSGELAALPGRRSSSPVFSSPPGSAAVRLLSGAQ